MGPGADSFSPAGLRSAFAICLADLPSRSAFAIRLADLPSSSSWLGFHAIASARQPGGTLVPFWNLIGFNFFLHAHIVKS
jgi:hypothetical protein